jgi:hypothetical protein
MCFLELVLDLVEEVTRLQETNTSQWRMLG